jgi:lysophospholipase L1-like esterase
VTLLQSSSQPVGSHPRSLDLPNKYISEKMLDRLLQIRHRDDVSILALGDSSVFGVGDYGDRLPAVGAGWTGRLAHDIGAVRFINVSRNGARARDLNTSQIKAALGMEPTLALVCIGTNDVLRGDFSPEVIRKNLVAFLRRLHQIESTVIFLGLPDPVITAPGPLSLRRILHRRVKIVNEILFDISVNEDAIFVSTWQLPYHREYWHVDRMHPSPQGHQVIANHVRSELALLRKSRQNIEFRVVRSKNFERYWLMTNGLKWFLKRSIDLIPGLIWLVLSERVAIRNQLKQKH